MRPFTYFRVLAACLIVAALASFGCTSQQVQQGHAILDLTAAELALFEAAIGRTPTVAPAPPVTPSGAVVAAPEVVSSVKAKVAAARAKAAAD